MAAKFMEMEYYSLKYAGVVRYQGFFSSIHEFAFLIERLELTEDFVKSIKIDAMEMDISKLFRKAEAVRVDAEEFS